MIHNYTSLCLVPCSDDHYPHPLHYAAALGSKPGVLRHLINWYGVDMNDDYSRTPLMFGALGNKVYSEMHANLPTEKDMFVSHETMTLLAQ